MAHDDSSLSVQIDQTDDIAVVRLRGDVCDDGIVGVRETVLNRISEASVKVLVDFGEVNYVSSSGIGMLVSLLKHCHRVGVPFAVTRLNDDIRELFSLTRLDQVFSIVTSAEDWQNSFV